ncbi:tetratricopeptide (TPR) repeat protein [Lewinella aquimaris]|uniref:Tetratricopeptide (TPR) repeat protein n=1 Tax=Neolewinella aquimaris TaxID=1835722 RepID=A0A840E3D6_9BACT|nr:hypothetical protein [Neolewinella aquimaris]MBB4080084.1 tetratricopeptide (TPR) repeat protein [Neolewinella aquimaris]
MKRPALLLLLLTGCLLLGAEGSAVEKEAIARTIFERLVAARGDASKPAPYFAFTSSKRSGARCEGNQVILEEAAYDVCTSFGPDAEAALAGMLAHEIVHYYAGHTDGGTAIGLVGDAGAAQQETEADYLGGFLAYLAGFPVANVMPRVLEAVYTAYDLPDALAGYPTLSERMALSERTFRETQQLITVFDMANVLTALDRHAEAALYFDYLLQIFPSREMYNNAGLVYARAALPLFQPATLTYVYPLELDLRSRLSGQTRGPVVDSLTRSFYLQTAGEHFERARLLDHDYAPALLNLASVHALLSASLLAGNPDSLSREVAGDRRMEATLRAREADRLAIRHGQGVTAANARVMLGILASLNDERDAAERHFSGAAESSLAVVNLSVLRNGKPPAATSGSRSGDFVMEERIAGRSIADLRMEAGTPHQEIQVSRGSFPIRLAILPPPDEHTSLLRHSANDGAQTLVVAATQFGYDGTTALEIAAGADRSAIVAEYGSPAYSLLTVGGELLVYPESRLIFSLRDGVLTYWMVYSED